MHSKLAVQIRAPMTQEIPVRADPSEPDTGRTTLLGMRRPQEIIVNTGPNKEYLVERGAGSVCFDTRWRIERVMTT